MNSGIMEAYSMRRHSAKVIPKQPGNARFRAQLAIQGKAKHAGNGIPLPRASTQHWIVS